MDTLILENLENFWMRVSISPYEVSRFFIVGSLLSMVAGTTLIFYQHKNNPLGFFVVGFMLIVWGRIAIREYREIKNSEKYNNKNRLNQFKYVDKGYRFMLSFFCIMNVTMYITEKYFDGFDVFNFTYYLLLIAAYFKAINWIKPEPKRFVVMQPT